MKTKIIFTALLLIAGQLTAQADNRDMFQQLSEHRAVTSVFISRTLLNMVSNFNTGGADIRSLAGRLTQIEIYNTNGNADANRIMREGMEKLVESGTYELLMRIRDEDTNVEFYAHEEEGFFRDLVMYIRDGNDHTLIRLMGRFSAEDIQKVMDSANNDNE